MTLLDAELFTRIPAPEALLWARDQCEERSPNLTRFTEHFNKMSYWYLFSFVFDIISYIFSLHINFTLLIIF